METIIQQIVSEVVEEFLAVVGEKGIESIEQAIENLTQSRRVFCLTKEGPSLYNGRAR